MGARRHTNRHIDVPDRVLTTHYATGSCSSGKRSYNDRSAAKQQARKIRGHHMSVYPCLECELFHIGHLPVSVLRGDASRSDLRETKHAALLRKTA